MKFLKRRSADILIADDDMTYASVLKSLLQLDGKTVRLVGDGVSALEAVRELGDRLDLFLCDLLLPRKSGFEVMKELAALDMPVPVIAMTAVYSNFREIHALRGLGVAGYVHKSTPFEHVLFRINNMLFPSRDNQRGDHRVAVSIPVKFSIGGAECYGASYNLSVSGIYVRTEEPVLAGAPVELALALPTATEMITMDAEIVHSATAGEVRGTAYPPGFGARFIDPSPLARAAVKRYVDLVHLEETTGVRAAEEQPETVRQAS